MSKKKLLIVAGAGASLDFGMPGVTDVDQILATEMQKHFSLADDPGNNLYKWLAHQIQEYWATAIPKRLKNAPNFEDIMYAVSAVQSAYPSGMFTSPLAAIISTKAYPDVMLFGRERTVVDANLWRALGSFLADAIVTTFRDKCAAIYPTNLDQLRDLAVFFAALQKRFRVSVVSLNYDDLIYRTTTDLETGFDQRGMFSDARLLTRRRWPCLLHLHGSVHFDMSRTEFLLHNIQWRDNLSSTFSQNAFGRSSINTTEGAVFPQSTIVAGLGKTSQILRRPFRTYYSELDRLVAESDALLCMGYGFGDAHLNSALESYATQATKPIVIIDCAGDDAMSASHAYYEPSSHIVEALRIFGRDARSMRALGRSSPTTVKGLRGAREFDLSINPGTPIAIWYNGMREACHHSDKVLMHLKTGRRTNVTAAISKV